MRTDQPVTIRRQDYTPPAFLIERIDLEFDLDPKATQVRATMQILRNGMLRNGEARPLVLNGEQLTLVDILLDGRRLEASSYRLDEETLQIDDVPERFSLTVVSRLAPESNSSLMGLYQSSGNYFTQCEAEGFRRITWFPDRPDVMARYRVTLRAPRDSCPVLLSNGNLVASGDCDGSAAAGGSAAGAGAGAGADSAADAAAGGSPDDGIDRRGWHWAVWEDPFPKPSYLFALVAGRLVVTEERLRTRSGRDVLLQVWVEPGNEDKTGHAMESLKHAIRWDEERFGLELDLDRFMIVAVGDFNMGAMENKGLNIFNTKYVFAHPRIATDQDFAAVESVVGHEYFHNWTGNRVTCRDWFQLTLKEGLTVFRDQEFSADMLAARSPDPRAADSARAVKRIEDVRLLRATQFPEDAGPMAHPIRPDTYQEINNFYTVTVYEKGAEVIRMLQTIAGRDGFRRGMDLYFARHDGHAVTCDDFVAAIADANELDLDGFRRWYSQAGTPRLRVTGSYDAATRRYALDIDQHCTPSPGQPNKQPCPVPLAVGLVGPDGRDVELKVHGATLGGTVPSGTPPGPGPGPGAAPARTVVLDVSQTRQRFVFDDVDAEPVPSLARHFSAPVIVEFDYSDAQLAFLAAHDSDPFNRWEAAQRLAVNSVLAVLDGADPATRCRALVDVFGGMLPDDALDPAFRDQVFILPSEGFIAEQLPVVDPSAVRQARNTVRMQLARQLNSAWRDRYQALNDGQPYAPDSASAGRRALKNTALAYWVETQEAAAIAAAAAQFDTADNMTDQAAALQALLRTAAPQRDRALADFSLQFADEPLVLDKWFSMQATMHRHAGEPPVLERVRTLMQHGAFSLRNPNKVRALVGSFCNGNLAEFHSADGSGYAFWREQVLAIDALNPQVAARLARALDRWRKFTPDRQAQMRHALSEVADHGTLSNDVREIVGKALAAG
ncbi:MAG: aminopeptidase N [Burkholderiaceae bacterium]